MELAPFGIEVTNLEPGGVETPMVELGPESETRHRASIPEALRDQYRRHFLPGAAVWGNFTLGQPDEFADAVWKKIVSARHLKPYYLIGSSQVRILPWLHRLLPAQQLENIWRRTYSRRPGR